MTILTVCNQKGGVGKTTTAVALASLIAARGEPTLLVDLDPHASATAYLLGAGASHGPGVMALFAPVERAARNAAPAAEAAVPVWAATAQPNLLMLPATPSLAAIERRCAGREGMGRVLARALETLEGAVRHVIVDCPPTLGLLMVNALAAADHVLIPVQTEHLALEGLKRMTATLDMVQRSQGRRIERTVLATLYDRRTRASCLALHALREEYPAVLWDEPVPVDTRLRDAAREGQPGPLYSPQSRAVLVYRRLLDALFGRAEPTVAAGLPGGTT